MALNKTAGQTRKIDLVTRYASLEQATNQGVANSHGGEAASGVGAEADSHVRPDQIVRGVLNSLRDKRAARWSRAKAV
jgi:hypothetical protein